MQSSLLKMWHGRVSKLMTRFEPSAIDLQISDLSKKATQLSKHNDLDSAINCLQQANDLMAKASLIYTIESRLRLPIYLQQAGRYTEAKAEFENLLMAAHSQTTLEFPRLHGVELVRPVAYRKSAIMDKMRLAAQREGDFLPACYFAVLSLAAHAVGRHYQSPEFDASAFYSDETKWEKAVANLLKKAGLGYLQAAVINAGMSFALVCSTDAYSELAEKLGELMNTSNYFASAILDD